MVQVKFFLNDVFDCNDFSCDKRGRIAIKRSLRNYRFRRYRRILLFLPRTKLCIPIIRAAKTSFCHGGIDREEFFKHLYINCIMNLAYIIRKNRIKIALGAILLFGLILRLWKLGVGAMWVDETISALVGRTILETGVPVFSSGWFYGRALVFHYLMALFLVFFNNDFGARLVSVVFGLGTVGLAYFVGREFDRKDKWLGIVSALFTAVLFLEVYYSRQARFYQMFQFLFFLTLFFLCD